MDRLECRFCPANYKYLRDLKTHEKKKHGVRKKFQCSQCNSQSNYIRNIHKHERLKHNIVHNPDPVKTKKNVKVTVVKCHLCTTCVRITKLAEHYKSEHSLDVETEEREFLSYEDFKSWKLEEERQNQSKFIKSTSTTSYKRCSDGENVSYEYYSCHYSGNYNPRGKGIRKLKAGGSRKIGMICTAEMKLTIFSNGKCIVKYVKTHVGHSHKLETLELQDIDNIFNAVEAKPQTLNEISEFPLQNSQHPLEIRDNSLFVIVEPYQENSVILNDSPISLQQKREELSKQFQALLNSANSVEELMFIEEECLRIQSQLSTTFN